MTINSERGWARTNTSELQEQIKKTISPKLNIRAIELAREQYIKDAARVSIGKSLKYWMPWLQQKAKIIIIKFANEKEGKPVIL